MIWLILLLVGFLLLITVFAIALVWDYTHGIWSFEPKDNAAMPEPSSNDAERNISPRSVEYPIA